MPGNFSGMGDR